MPLRRIKKYLKLKQRRHCVISHQLVEIKKQNKNTIVLNLREAACIRGILDGKNSLEIAQSFNLSKRSVEFYLRNGKRKLDMLIESYEPTLRR